MWFTEIVLQAWFQIKAYALRSFLTALGIIIAVTGVITIACVMSSLESGVNRELNKLGAQNIIIGTNFNKVFSGQSVNSLSQQEWNALRNHVKGISTVVATAKVHSIGKIQFNEKKYSIGILAASSELPVLYQLFPKSGRFLIENDENGHLRVCVISESLIVQLGLPLDPIGTKIQVGKLLLNIIGVMPGNGKTGGSLTQIGEMYIPFSVAEELSGQESEFEFGFRVQDKVKHDYVLQQVKQVLRQSQRTKPEDDDDFRIEDAAQIKETNDLILAMISLVLTLVVSISLIVGGIGIMNVMLVSVTERTREIGILLALGATKQQIRIQFLVEASILSGLGAILGIFFGWFFANIIVLFIPNTQGAAIPIWAVISSVITAIGVGLISGALPAARAAELDPVVALSKE